MGLGIFAVMDGRVDESRKYFVDVLARDPGRARANLMLAFIDGTLSAVGTPAPVRRIAAGSRRGHRARRVPTRERARPDDSDPAVCARHRAALGHDRSGGGRRSTCECSLREGGARRAGLDAGPHRLQGALPRHAQRVRLGAPEAGRNVPGADAGVLVHLSRPRLQAAAHRRAVPVGFLRRGHQDGAGIAPCQGVSVQEDEGSALGARAHLDRQSADHAGRVQHGHRRVPDAGRFSRRRCQGSLSLPCTALR